MATKVFAALMPLVPLAVALLGLLLPRRSRALSATLAIGGATVAFISAIYLAVSVNAPVTAATLLVNFGGIPVTVGMWLNPAAAYVAVAVATVALGVQIYSVGYLHDDTRYAPYAAQVSLFTAAMMTVVISWDLIPVMVGWEVMGICSYLLIGHDRRLKEAPGAAVKAFIVTRTGDIGFMLGVALLGVRAGSFRISDITAAAASGKISHVAVTTACILLLGGVAGKSAQFPLHTWLPDAMAGPTPISALIHAATMVAAGIYLVTRVYPLYTMSPVALAVLGVMASITMLLAALVATSQNDIKKVFAWSTVSQIAYMAGGLAVGAAPAALFHLLTHAAFKALLFLTAGVVIHAIGSNMMSEMGGMRRALPTTFASMTIGLAALAGIPPFSGFWSKDALLAAAETAREGAGPAYAWTGWLVWIIGLLTAVVTAWYATRVWLMVWFGTPRSQAARHPHPSGWAMLGPVVVLAVPAAVLGFAALDSGFAAHLDVPGAAPEKFVHVNALAALPLLAVAIGLVAGWLAWRGDRDPVRVVPAREVWTHAAYLDDVQDALVVRPVYALAGGVRRADEGLVDGAVVGAGRGTFDLGGLVARFHRAGLPRAATAVLGGALIIGVIAAVIGGVS